jgi:chromosome segregation ATPase
LHADRFELPEGETQAPTPEKMGAKHVADDNEAPLPVPDPTRLSTEAIARGLKNERDYVDGQIAIVLARIETERVRCEGHVETLEQRLADIDKATNVLSETVNRVPTDLQTAIKDVLRLMDERDRRVEDRFLANEKLSKTESELNQTALAAALAAQEKASAVSTNSLETRITGQGASTDRTIDKNAELAAVATSALGARVTQLNDQLIALNREVTGILAGKTAVSEQKVETRGGLSSVYGGIGMAVGVVGLVIAAIAIIVGTR